MKTIKKIICAISLLAFAFSALSCEEKRSAYSVMSEFCLGYRLESTIYHPAANEWDAGFHNPKSFMELYGVDISFVEDYAVVLNSGVGGVSECGVFFCYSDRDAFSVYTMLEKRKELIRSSSAYLDVSAIEDAFIMKRGRVVVISVLSDNERAMALWKKIL